MSVTNFDERADALGMTRCIFPNGKSVCKTKGDNKDSDSCDDTSCGCFKDKLREFIEYQIPQYYLETAFSLGILLTSAEGKALFKEAMQLEHMECFYTISQNIEHQNENTCGITSLMIALNSLAIDPARATWYQEYRWHHLGSLACGTARPQNANVKLNQYCCMAVCNDTLAYPIQAEDDLTLERLRFWVKMVTSRSDVVMVVNFGRITIQQRGIGHFLPISGYHEGSDMVLLLETAKHKYPAFWLRLSDLAAAMYEPDISRGSERRGFCLLTRPDYDPSERLFSPSLLLRLDDYAGIVEPMLKSFMASWNKWLNTEIPPLSSSLHEILPKAIEQFMSSIKDSKPTGKFSLMELSSTHFRCDTNNRKSSIIARCRKPHNPASCHSRNFCQQLQTLEVFTICKESIKDCDRERILDLVVCDLQNIDQAVLYTKSTENIMLGQFNRLATALKNEKLENDIKIHHEHECPGYVEFLPEHILSFIILSWPFGEENCDSIPALRNFILRDRFFDSDTRSTETTVHVDIAQALKTVEQNENKIELHGIDDDTQNSIIPKSKDVKFTAEMSPNGFHKYEKGFETFQVSNCSMTIHKVLNDLMMNQVSGLPNPRYLQHHVKAMKRKLKVILLYHQLL